MTSPTTRLTRIIPSLMSALNINSKVRLNSGYEIPLLGFGVYQTPDAEAEAIVDYAVSVGYRHVDSAVYYQNEGSSTKGLLKSGIPRDQLFFTTKVPTQMGSVGYEETVKFVNRSMELTGLEYIDLILLHSPHGGKEKRAGAWKALVEAVDAGKVRSIGVSNYGVHHLEELTQLQKDLKAAGKNPGALSVNQVEIHPWLPRPDIIKWCKDHGVVVEAYSPLVRGERMGDPILTKLSKKHNKSEAQILLRWSLQMGLVILPKSVTPKRVKENTDLYDFELDAEDMKDLDTGAYEPCSWDPTKLRD